MPEAGDGGHVDDSAAACPPQRVDRKARAVESAEHVGGKIVGPVLERLLRMNVGVGRVVHQNAERPKCFFGERDQGADLIFGAHIAGAERGAAAGALDEANCLAAARFVDIGYDHPSALPGEAQRNGAAGSVGARAGDDDSLVANLHGMGEDSTASVRH